MLNGLYLLYLASSYYNVLGQPATDGRLLCECTVCMATCSQLNATWSPSVGANGVEPTRPSFKIDLHLKRT